LLFLELFPFSIFLMCLFCNTCVYVLLFLSSLVTKKLIVIIIIIIIIISSPLYRIFTLIFLRQTMSLGNGIECCSYSVVTINVDYIVSFSVESIVLLH